MGWSQTAQITPKHGNTKIPLELAEMGGKSQEFAKFSVILHEKKLEYVSSQFLSNHKKIINFYRVMLIYHTLHLNTHKVEVHVVSGSFTQFDWITCRPITRAERQGRMPCKA